MPKSALPPAAPAPARQARPAATSGRSTQEAWLRRTLVILLLIVITGVVPILLMGELLGWWLLSRSAPFVFPRATPGALQPVQPALAALAAAAGRVR